ncbi:unnamed protein product [Owenia fusiformis]|uniref:Uncharacterized protein n=1 Tax=Owenia fusiformis TaxID=6347 RepID=A0A8J1Y9C1_OWEFU|nr:unnamed protein product [Owenia fusiformis]
MADFSQTPVTFKSISGWVPNTLDTYHFIQADLGQLFVIRGVQTRGRGDTLDNSVLQYKLQYIDKMTCSFVDYEEPHGSAKIFAGNSEYPNNTVTHFLEFPFVRQCVRIRPTVYGGLGGLRFEVLGTEFENLDFYTIRDDSSGSDISNHRNVNREECAILCEQLEDCQGFIYDSDPLSIPCTLRNFDAMTTVGMPMYYKNEEPAPSNGFVDLGFQVCIPSSNDVVITNVLTYDECKQLCLDETSIVCWSVEYGMQGGSNSLNCQLSAQYSGTVTIMNPCEADVFYSERIPTYDYDPELYGILASAWNGIVTNSSWKCSGTFEEGWFEVDFDDSAWAAAVEVSTNKSTFIPDVTGKSWDNIAENAKGIWTNGMDDVVYCRLGTFYLHHLNQ